MRSFLFSQKKCLCCSYNFNKTFFTKNFEKTFLIPIFLFQFLIFLNAHQAWGQNETLKQREKDFVLVVLFPKRNTEFEEKAKKKNNEAALARYNQQLTDLSNNLKEAVGLIWKLNDNPVQYKNTEDFNYANLTPTEKANTLILTLKSLNTSNISRGQDYMVDKEGSIVYYTPAVDLRGAFTPWGNIGGLRKVDMILGVQRVQNDVRKTLANEPFDKNAWKKIPLPLKEKTLFLDKELLKDGLTEEKIKEIYPYSFKIVNSTEIENAILQQIAEVAYIAFIPDPQKAQGDTFGFVTVTKKEYIQCVVSAYDGTDYIDSSTGSRLKGSVLSDGNAKIDVEDLKRFVKAVAKAEKE
jgi:hypothetical protein